MMMAAVGKFFCRQSWSILRSRLAVSKVSPGCIRFINTSKNNKESLTVPDNNTEYLKEVEKFEDISDLQENWVSHGYNDFDAEDDIFWHHHTMFFTISIAMVLGAFIVAYYPDYRLTHWKQREAYLRIAERERLGLPLVDPNFVEPEKMKKYLPSDEELGDTEIAI